MQDVVPDHLGQVVVFAASDHVHQIVSVHVTIQFLHLLLGRLRVLFRIVSLGPFESYLLHLLRQRTYLLKFSRQIVGVDKFKHNVFKLAQTPPYFKRSVILQRRQLGDKFLNVFMHFTTFISLQIHGHEVG